MNGVVFSVLSFIVAIGILVTVHEFGHFWVARRLGVKVLRFSVGFGRPLWSRRFGRDNTELVIASVPLGGYVKMLDEHEGEVPEDEKHRAFNRQPLKTRIAVVVAGPVFNFLFAVLAYWVMYMAGVTGLRPVVGEVVASSYAAQAGFEPGDEILSLDNEPTPTWESVVLALLDVSLGEHQTLTAIVQNAQGNARNLKLDLDESASLLKKGNLLENFGLKPWRPVYPPVIDRLSAGGPAERAGLRGGDRIVSVNGESIRDWNQWVETVRSQPGKAIAVQLERQGEVLDFELKPESVMEDGIPIGRIGAYVRLPEDSEHAKMRIVVRYGLIEAFAVALEKTGDMTTLTLRTLWKMITGRASVENLSGPISIAQYAGQSASIGLSAFLGFLAIVSISLGVLNLLPVPMLDGGHLMYYLVEFFKGSPVSENVQLLGQKIGIFALLLLMSLAFYNDLTRLFD